jgi:hypothetical protein
MSESEKKFTEGDRTMRKLYDDGGPAFPASEFQPYHGGHDQDQQRDGSRHDANEVNHDR